MLIVRTILQEAVPAESIIFFPLKACRRSRSNPSVHRSAFSSGENTGLDVTRVKGGAKIGTAFVISTATAGPSPFAALVSGKHVRRLPSCKKRLFIVATVRLQTYAHCGLKVSPTEQSETYI